MTLENNHYFNTINCYQQKKVDNNKKIRLVLNKPNGFYPTELIKINNKYNVLLWQYIWPNELPDDCIRIRCHTKHTALCFYHRLKLW